MPKCKAKNRQGDRCGRNAVVGREVCNLHGGKALRGIAAPQVKTGRYSKYLPARLLDRYNESVDDPELLNLKAEISLLDSRLADLLKRVDGGGSGEIWKQLERSVFDLEVARSSKDQPGILKAVNTMTALVGQGRSDYAAWDEIVKAIDQRKRLVESERKRLQEMQQFVTSEQAMLLITALTESVKKHVTDRTALAAISEDLIRFSSIGAGARTDGG